MDEDCNLWVIGADDEMMKFKIACEAKRWIWDPSYYQKVKDEALRRFQSVSLA